VAALPDAPPQPWLAPRPGAPAGQVERHLVRSAVLGNERRVWVYTPPDDGVAGARAGPYDLVLFFDGWHYRYPLRTATTLDNLATP
jgi:enterochelin esterase-like enzyme